MQVFNILLRPAFAFLHETGYESSVYVDVSLLLAQIFEECLGNVLSTIPFLSTLVTGLEFSIHPTKPIFAPTPKIKFLAIEIDTLNMTLTQKEIYSCSIAAKRVLKHDLP